MTRSRWAVDLVKRQLCRPNASFRRSIASRPNRRNGQPLHFVVRFSKWFGTDWQKTALFILP
jgi:hypothetical protein